MFWLIDSCQNSFSADQYRLTVSRAQVSTHWVRVFFEVIRWQVATFQMIPGSSSIFLKCRYEISRVYEPHFKNFDFELTSDAKIQLAFTCREGNRFWFFSLSRVDHALRPIFMFWLVKILCGKFLQRLETCLLIAGAERVLCHLMMF